MIPTLYCFVCGLTLEVVHYHQLDNKGTVRPCPECAPAAYAKSMEISQAAHDQSAKAKKSHNKQSGCACA